jgi:hypothetical protein
LEELPKRVRRGLAERVTAALIVGAIGFACSGPTFTSAGDGSSGAGGSGAPGGGSGGKGSGGKGGTSSGSGGSTGGSAGKASGGTDSSGGSDTGGTGQGGTGGRGGSSTGGSGGSGDTGGTDAGGSGSGNAAGAGGSGNASGHGGTSAGNGGSGNTSGAGNGGVSGSAGTGGTLGGAGGTLGGTGGTGGSGNAAGTGGRGGAECETASDCQMVSDCCTCAAEPKSKLLPVCQSVCVTDQCTSKQIAPSEVACEFGRCVIARSCNLAEVSCEVAQPVCPVGTIPSVQGNCFGPCLPPTECSSVTSCSDCANLAVCVRNEAQLQTYGCVVPAQSCQSGSYCSCLGACMSPFNACMEAPEQVNCSCPNC